MNVWAIVGICAAYLATIVVAGLIGFKYAVYKQTAAQGEAFIKAKKEADAHGDEIRKMPDADLDKQLDEWMRRD